MSDDKLFHKRSMPPKGKRPVLPETTPSPALAGGRTNAYSTIMEPQVKSSGDVIGQMESIDYRRPSEVALNKIVNRLPIDIRENVSNVVAMALTDSAISRRSMADISNEMLLLRAELKRKNTEQEQANQRCAIYADRLNIMEQKMSGLQDNIETHQKFSFRSKKAVNRLSTTNRMLIDAFEALQTGHNYHKPTIQSMQMAQSSPMSLQLGASGSPENQGLNSSESSSLIQGASNPGKNTTQNDKLRESLLRIAREHYKTVRMAETLELTVDELQGKLKQADGKVKDMETELSELRDLNAERLNSGDYIRPSQQDEGNQLKIKSIRELQDVVDDKLKRLLDRNAFDPVDGLTQMRRLLAIFEAAPTALHTLETAFYLCSRYVCKVFDVEMISFYIYCQGTLTRYSTGKTEVELYHIHGSSETSVVQEILKSGQPMRFNNMKEGRMPSIYNADVDGADNVTVKKLLAVPIQDRRNKVTFGVLTFTNRSRNPASPSSFSEIDEIFATMFAEQASTLLSACILYRNLVERSDLLTSLLESSTSLFKAVPDPKSLASTKLLRVEDILFTLESVARDVLKCSKCRAIFLSEYCNGTAGKLIALEAHSRGKKPTYTSAKTMLSAPVSSGIAGHVITSRRPYLAYDVEDDSVFNPAIDLETVEAKLFTVPIIDIYGTVTACLQLVPGPTSPKFRDGLNDDHAVCFEEAAEWLVHQVSTPLSFLMKNVGQSYVVPLSTPKAISSVDMTSNSRLTLLPKDYFEDKDQLTVVAEEAEMIANPPSPSRMRQSSLSARQWKNTADSSPFGAKAVLPRTPSGIVRTTFTVVETFHHEDDLSMVSSVPSSPRHVPNSKPVTQVAEGISFVEHNAVKIELKAARARLEAMTNEEAARKEKEGQLERELEALKTSFEELRLKCAAQSEDTEKLQSEHRQSVDKLKQEEAQAVEEAKQALDVCQREKAVMAEELKQTLIREEQTKKQLDALVEVHSKCPTETVVSEQNYEELERKQTEMLARERQLLREQDALQQLVRTQQDEISAHKFELETLKEDLRLSHITNENQKRERSESLSSVSSVPEMVIPKRRDDLSGQKPDNSSIDSPEEPIVAPTPSASDLLNAAVAASPEGPKGEWLEMKDAEGGVYYYNRVTGESALHPSRTPRHPPRTPHSLQGHADDAQDAQAINADEHHHEEGGGYEAGAAVDGDWARYYDDTVGRYYWYNSVTEQSEWDDGTGHRESVGLKSDYVAGYDEETPYNHQSNGSADSFSTNVSATAGGYTIEL